MSTLRAAAVRVPAFVAALGIVPLLVLVLRRGVDLPFSDELDWADLIYGAHRHALGWAQFWAPHNEHRIVVPNLIVLALASGGWNVVREQLFSLALLAATQAILFVLVWRTVPVALRGGCFLVASALLLGIVQYENLEWGFQFAWFLCNLCAVFAVWQLARPRRAPRSFTLALLAAVVASVSSLPGLLVWPAGLVAIALVPGDRRRALATWVVAGAVTTAVVRWGVHAAPGGELGLHHAGALAQYALIYLGTPLALSYGISASALAGVLVVVWLAVTVVVALRASPLLRMRLASWYGLAAYALLGAAATAFGRIGFGLAQAAAPRYSTLAELAWIAAFAATCIELPRGARWRYPAAAVLGLAVLAGSVQQSRAGDLAWRLHVQALREARAAIARGDPSGLTALYPYPRRARSLLGEMARVRDGIFLAPR